MRVAVLISGRGSNMAALLAAGKVSATAAPVAGAARAAVAVVLSNEPQAPGLVTARDAGVATEVVCHRDFPSREAFDAALLARLARHAPDVVALAGFMRILTPTFIGPLAGRLLNIHPSLLPKFPGLDTHRRAIEAGAAEHGATVHFVTPDLDAGPRIIRARVPVLCEDSPQTLAARVLTREHRIYPLALDWYAAGRLRLDNGRAHLDGRVLEQPVDLDTWDLAATGVADP